MRTAHANRRMGIFGEKIQMATSDNFQKIRMKKKRKEMKRNEKDNCDRKKMTLKKT